MKAKLTLILIGYAIKMLANWADKKEAEALLEELNKVTPSDLAEK